MSQERSLEELIRESMKALRYAELVGIAKNHTPNKARRVAEQRWPPRQARACRFLAIIRRDHPEEFQNIVATRRARSAGSSGTEHARGAEDMATKKDVQEKRRLIALEPNRARRITLCLRYGLRDDAELELDELVTHEQTVYLQNGNRHTDLTKIDNGEPLAAEAIVCFGESRAYLTLSGIAAALGWDRKELAAFARKVIQRMIALNPRHLEADIANGAGSWEINALAQAVGEFLSAQDEVRAHAWRWLLIAWFFDVSWFYNNHSVEWQRAWIGRNIPWRGMTTDENDRDRADIEYKRARTRALLNRLMELGMSREQLIEELRLWLEKWTGNTHSNFIVAVASQELFPSQDKRRCAALKRLAPQAIECLCKGWVLFSPYHVASLGKSEIGCWGEDPEIVALYREGIAKALGEGRIGCASQIHVQLYRVFGFVANRKPDLDWAVPAALDYALSNGRFGIAAALIRDFGDAARIDMELLLKRAGDERQTFRKLLAERQGQIEKVADMAHVQNQPIRLDYSLSFLQPY